MADEQAAKDAPTKNREEAPEEAPSSTPAAKKALGTIDDWVREYVGGGEPDTQKPPRLGVLADVPSLPRSTLVYVRSGTIIRADLPSGAEAHLNAGRFSSSDPRFTRDGRTLFFLSNRDGGAQKIFRMSPEGADIRPVTQALRRAGSSEWDASDDGAHVAYVKDVGEGTHELHLVRVDNGADKVIYRGVMLSYPSFSRDGRALFFVEGWLETLEASRGNTKKIASIDLASLAKKSLPNGGYAEITSPWDLGDGRLLFAASVDFYPGSREPRMFTMPTSGGAWSAVGDFGVPSGYLSAVPTLDRKRLAVEWSARRGGFGANWISDVSVMPLAGGPSKRLSPGFPRPFYSASSPAWAPDGRHLAFVLNLCPYMECEINIRSVVVVDTEADKPKLAFVGYGGSPVFSPAPP